MPVLPGPLTDVPLSPPTLTLLSLLNNKTPAQRHQLTYRTALKSHEKVDRLSGRSIAVDHERDNEDDGDSDIRDSCRPQSPSANANDLFPFRLNDTIVYVQDANGAFEPRQWYFTSAHAIQDDDLQMKSARRQHSHAGDVDSADQTDVVRGGDGYLLLKKNCSTIRKHCHQVADMFDDRRRRRLSGNDGHIVAHRWSITDGRPPQYNAVDLRTLQTFVQSTRIPLKQTPQTDSATETHEERQRRRIRRGLYRQLCMAVPGLTEDGIFAANSADSINNDSNVVIIQHCQAISDHQTECFHVDWQLSSDDTPHHDTSYNNAETDNCCGQTDMTSLHKLSSKEPSTKALDEHCLISRVTLRQEFAQLIPNNHVVSGRIYDRIKLACNAIARHVALISHGRLSLSHLSAYWQISRHDQLCLLCADQLQLTPVDVCTTTVNDAKADTTNETEQRSDEEKEVNNVCSGDILHAPTMRADEEKVGAPTTMDSAPVMSARQTVTKPGFSQDRSASKLSVVSEDPLASIRLYEVPSHLNDNPQSWSEQVWQTLWAEREAKRTMLLNEELERRRLDDAERTLMVKRTIKHRQPQPSFFSNRRSSLMSRSSQLAITRSSGANIIDAHTFAIVPSVQAPSNWQDRGNVHRMQHNRYAQDRRAVEQERRAVWDGTKRLSAATAASLLQRAAVNDESRKQQTPAPATASTSLPLMTVSLQLTPSIPLRPTTAAANKPVRSLAQLLRASTNAGTLLPAKNGALPKFKAARFKCPRCRLRSKHKTFSATLYALITEFERIQSIFQSNLLESPLASTPASVLSTSASAASPSAPSLLSGPTVIPPPLIHTFPDLSVSEYEYYRKHPPFLASTVECCRDCAVCLGIDVTAKIPAADEKESNIAAEDDLPCDDEFYVVDDDEQTSTGSRRSSLFASSRTRKSGWTAAYTRRSSISM